MDYHLITADSIPLRHTPFTIAILATAYLSVLVLGLVGNVFFIIVVLKMPKMKPATKYFLLNLAIADLLVLIFCLLPSLISNIYVPWIMGSLMCKTVPYIQGVSVCASVYSLVAISVDRYIASGVPPIRQVTKRMARRIIVLIWMWAAGLAFPWLLYFDTSNANRSASDPPLVLCTESWPSTIYGNIYFGLVNLGLFYVLPLMFIYSCHLGIWLRIRRGLGPKVSSVCQIELARKEAQASLQKFVILVVVAFAICWLPLYAIFVRIKLIPVVLGATEEEVLHYALPISQWLGAANSCISPILYGFFNRNFRVTQQRLLRGSSASNKAKSCPNPRHRRTLPNLKLNLVRLIIKRHRIPPTNRPLKNSHNSANFGESKMVTLLHLNNQNMAVITRSLTYKAAMKNPW